MNMLFSIKSFHWKILFFSISIIISLIEANERNDFTIYQLAAKDLINHINPYKHSYIDGYYYYYSLLFAYLIYPFSFLTPYWSNFLWLIINFYFLYVIIIRIAYFMKISKYPSKTQITFYSLLILFSVRCIRENLHSGQVTILILFLMLCSLYYLWKNNTLLSALFCALSVNIKLLGLPLLAYFIYRGYFKTAIYTIFFMLIFFVLPIFWMGTEFYLNCIQYWWSLVNPSNIKHLIDVEERSYHSITTLLTTLLLKNPPDIHALPIRRHILELDTQQVIIIIQIVRILLITSVLFIIRSFPFQKTTNQFYLFFESAYIFALIPLIFPHQQHYAFLLYMPASAILIYGYLNRILTKLHSLVMLIIFLCFNLKIILGVFNDYYDHFKILTYGALLFIFLMLASVQKIKTCFIA